jgi:hypothetical protein
MTATRPLAAAESLVDAPDAHPVSDLFDQLGEEIRALRLAELTARSEARREAVELAGRARYSWARTSRHRV